MMFPLENPATLDDPFPFFRRCRAESPILFHAAWNAWLFFRHEDITAMSREPRLSNRRMNLFLDAAPASLRGRLDFLENELSEMVLMLDGEKHRHVRQIVQQGFSGPAVQRIQERIAHHVDTLLGGLDGAFDASTQLCRRLPLLVLADILGIPGADFPRLLRWAHAFVDYFNRMPVPPEEQTVELAESGREIIAYVRGLIAERRKNPGTDFLSTLIHAESEGRRLTVD